MSKIPDHISKDGMSGAPEEEGIVIKLERNLARVKIVKGSGCATCAIASKCPFTAATPKDWHVWAKNDIGAVENDRVKVAISPGSYLLIAALVFIMPVAFLLAGYFISMLLGAIEQLAVTIGVTFAFLAYFVVRRFDRSSLRERSYRVVEIIGKEEVEKEKP